MAAKILIASPLRPYTDADEVQADGVTLGELLNDLDARYPGIRFRMIDEQDQVRRHMRIFINGEPVKNLAHPIRSSDEVSIVQALSGG
jgi:molybdopterin converting factor small subunit